MMCLRCQEGPCFRRNRAVRLTFTAESLLARHPVRDQYRYRISIYRVSGIDILSDNDIVEIDADVDDALSLDETHRLLRAYIPV